MKEDVFIDIVAHQTYYSRKFGEQFGNDKQKIKENLAKEMNRVMKRYRVDVDQVRVFTKNHPGFFKDEQNKTRFFTKLGRVSARDSKKAGKVLKQDKQNEDKP
ncbi:MAG: hypothetical protein JXJ19_09320 [Elusimicrobia bacterium]|nr:hypothetical protein [Elusimicrobiota bacterium]